jgi:glucokinase
VLREPTEQTFRSFLTGAGYRPTAQVRIAELGHEAGLIGAADLARLR